MSDYTISRFDEAADVFGDRYPGEMRFLAPVLETTQVALTHRRMPPQSGGKGGYGHRHRTQEEVYVVLSGRVEVKLDDEVVAVEAPAAVRVAPEVVRSVWNEGPADAELLILSTRLPAEVRDAEMVEGFWPA